MGLGISKEDQQLVNEFVEAARQGDETKVDELKDQQLNGKNESGDTALHVAAQNGLLNICLLLLDDLRALESDARDTDLATPLMLACNAGHLEIAQKLVKSGAKPHLVDIMGWTSLHHACSNGHAVVVRYLLDRMQTDTYFQLDSAGCSPLWLAAAAGDPETVRILLCYGANPVERNTEGVSVLRAVDYESADRALVVKMIEIASEVWTAAAAKEETGEVADLLQEQQTEEGGRDLFAKQGTAEGGPGLFEYDDEEEPPHAEEIALIRKRAVAKLLAMDMFTHSYLPMLGSSAALEEDEVEGDVL